MIILFDVKKRRRATRFPNKRFTLFYPLPVAIPLRAQQLYCIDGASASLDIHYDVSKSMKNTSIENAVPGGAKAILRYVEQPARLTAAEAFDCIRLWDVTAHGKCRKRSIV